MQSIKELIGNCQSLIHLDISFMGLGPKLENFMDGIYNSKNLLSVHMGTNNITRNHLMHFLDKFKIDKSLFGGILETERYHFMHHNDGRTGILFNDQEFEIGKMVQEKLLNELMN